MHALDRLPNVIRIEVLRHTSGMLLGTSPDLPGFSHAANTVEQFEAEIDEAIKDMVEATGRSAVRVEHIDHVSPANGFGLFSLNARIESEAA